MAKEYPIQNVSFRGETDNFLTEAGGGSELPIIPVTNYTINDLTISLGDSHTLSLFKFYFHFASF